MRLLFIAAILFASTALSAEQKIDGAFGFKFGQVLAPESDRWGRVEDERGPGIRYGFEPEKAFGQFKDYSVFATPISDKTYKIVAEGQFDSKSACEGELFAVKEDLDEIYGPAEDNIGDLMHGVPIARYGSVPNRIVLMCLSMVGEHQLFLTYIDDELEQRAKSERARMSGAERDKSNL